MDPLERKARNYALLNAWEHGGRANPGSVVGKLVAADPSLKADIVSVGKLAARVCKEVSSLSREEQHEELLTHAPELLERGKRDDTGGLKPFNGADGGVVMRLAPNPSGPLHLGHTRMSILNDEYVKMHGGRLILRFEDTNPAKVMPEAYDMIRQDLEWLGVEVHDEVIQSDRFDIYYDVAARLIKDGHAYACTCRNEDWRALKADGMPCPHRDRPAEETLDIWYGMLDGTVEEGAASLVVKTDIAHSNPAVRDFVAFRVMDVPPHPRTGDRYRVYPLMNLSVATDDHMLGLTHVLRGKDHLNNTLRQRYVFDYMGWEPPRYYHYGWVSIDGTILKTSEISRGIAEARFSGWDDPRLGTIRALRKRGIRPEAIRKVWLDAGVKEVDITFSWSHLYSSNRELVNPEAPRLFFVSDPVKVTYGGGKASVTLSNHPDNPLLGERTIRLGGPPREVFVQREDVESVEDGGVFRLKDLGNFERAGGAAVYLDDSLSRVKERVPIFQWVPFDAVPHEILMPDGSVVKGLIEPGYLSAVGKVVQFERRGFVRLEEGRSLFCHK